MASKKGVSELPTIGADPEFFVRRRDTGSPFPIVGLLGGTKGKPIPIGPGGIYGMQEDNVMAEYNIPPCADHGTFARHIMAARNHILEHLNKEHGNQYELDSAPSRLFASAALQTPQAKMFGCSPDFNAYDLGHPIPRISPEVLATPEGEWRFCGGHVHLGYKHLLKAELPDYVAAQFADVFLSLPHLGQDKQGKRREFYGTPGRYRPTPYGIEYRSLSNLWTTTPGLPENVGYYALALCNFLANPESVIKAAWSEVPWNDVRTAITTEDARLAQSIRSYCSSTIPYMEAA